VIGIVIVSHSAKLAEGVVELARTMGGEDVLIQAAGGLDLPESTLGTDPILIQNAIHQVYSEDGVLVLMDLGSALLSTEMAVDLLPEEQQKNILLCEAPLVEGAISAAVQARIGSSLEAVADEARNALAAKAEHLSSSGLPQDKPLPTPVLENAAEKKQIDLDVNNQLGLHARPAARLVKTAGQYPNTNIQIENLSTGIGPVNAKSINAIFTLSVLKGQKIRVSVSGAEAEAVLNAIVQLSNENFGDTNEVPTTPAPAKLIDSNASFTGLPASDGLALGKITHFHTAIIQDIPKTKIDDPSQEWQILQHSIDAVILDIKHDLQLARQKMGKQTSEIFEAHLLVLEDEEILAPARKAIMDQRLNAAAAWHKSITAMAERYQNTGNDYLRSRVQDIQDIGQQVLRKISGVETTTIEISEPCILIASDLSPAETSRLDKEKILGICTAQGGVTSHTAILARSMGIPAICGAGVKILQIQEGSLAILNGNTGELFIHPSEELKNEYQQKAIALKAANEKAKSESHLPAITTDQHAVEIAANIGSIAEAAQALEAGAEGVGLFRTEFLFLQRDQAPSEEEQYQVYSQTAKTLQGKSLIIRTLDIGGDKFVPYLNLPHEDNPFLGWRAIRLCLSETELFKTQLRAIVRTAVEYPVKIMFPMIATVQEFLSAKAILNEVTAEILEKQHLQIADIPTGIMVEIPAAAIKADQFAKVVDFFSIGTNDLTQYTMAAERGNANVAQINDPFHPAVLQLIQGVVQAAHAENKWVGVCGEMAGDPLAIPLLLGLGVDELSMSSPGIARAKQLLRSLNYKEAAVLAEKALQQISAEDVKKLH
jgi:multiphosphoryl transfer protein